jgi:integrase
LGNINEAATVEDLQTLLESYFDLNPKIRTDKTVKQYRIAFKNFAAAIGKAPELEDLTDDNISRLIKYLSSRELAAKTINERRGRIHAFWNFLARRGILRHWPMTPRIPEPVRTPIAWLQPEIDQLFQTVDRLEGRVGIYERRRWWKALLLMGWDTGERIGALLDLKWDHLSGEWIHIPAEIRKGKRRDSAHRLAQDTLTALRAIKQPERPLIFPWPFDPLYIYSRYGEILKEAGLPHDYRCKFHRLRRSVASHFEAAGGNAMKLLGHGDRRTTEGYLDPRIVKVTQATDLLFRPQADAG